MAACIVKFKLLSARPMPGMLTVTGTSPGTASVTLHMTCTLVEADELLLGKLLANVHTASPNRTIGTAPPKALISMSISLPACAAAGVTAKTRGAGVYSKVDELAELKDLPNGAA